MPAKEHSGVTVLAGALHALPRGLCSQSMRLCPAWLRHAEKSPVPSRSQKPIISAVCSGFNELPSSHKEFLSSHSTSNTIIYRSGTCMTEGLWGPTTNQNPTVLSTVQIQSKEMILSPESLYLSIKWKNLIINRLMTICQSNHSY